ncbi:MAG: sugar phosphate isomerase/epimerase [Clostridia bacterium]|nr:sugar phosphate isomerase/epimerase [Clostridia bacterium]
MKKNMKLSTTTEPFFQLFGYEEGIRTLAEIGYDALDMNLITCIYNDEFSDSNLEATCAMLLKTAKECGIYFNQAHAPFPSYRFMADKEKMDEYNEKVYPKLINSIKAAGILGAEQIIVHPIDVPDKSIQKEFNLEFYNKLVPYCREYNIKVALENMWGHSQVDTNKIVPNVCSLGRDLGDYYDALDPKYFTVCLDVGHCGLVGESADNAIRALGSRLHALHVHDNDHVRDLHTIPYMGRMDWDAITKALADVDYDGDFTYEVCGAYTNPYKNDKILMRKAFELMEVTGRNLISKIYEAKAQ